MKWASKNNLGALLFPVESEKLPHVVEPGERIGTITKEASAQTGIGEGVPVVACGSDKGCETLAWA